MENRPKENIPALSQAGREFKEEFRMRPRLRIFTGEDVGVAEEPQVSIRLDEIAPILCDAVRWDCSWLTDFADDEIRISEDLYEILTAYSHLRPSA